MYPVCNASPDVCIEREAPRILEHGNPARLDERVPVILEARESRDTVERYVALSPSLV